MAFDSKKEVAALYCSNNLAVFYLKNIINIGIRFADIYQTLFIVV